MIISRLLASTTAHLPFVRVGKAAVCQARVQLPDCNQRLATELSANKRSQTMGTNALSLGSKALCADHGPATGRHRHTHLGHNQSSTSRQTSMPMQIRSGAASFVTAASSSQSLKLAIIGGGIGGLTCARILQKNGCDVVIFEREPSRDSRGQGGNVDLHVESGQWALRQAGLFDQFCALILEGGQDLRIVDNKGTVHWEEEGPPGVEGRPEISRPALRGMLLDALHPGTVKWGHHLVAIEPQLLRGHSLRFADGTNMAADVVVGADGARSRVRPLVTDAKPTYGGACWFDIRIPDADQMHPDVAKYVGRGLLCALGDNKGIFAHHIGDGSIHAYASCRMSEDSFTQLQLNKAWESAAASRQAVATIFEGWAPEITRLIQACDITMTPRPFTALPVGLTWTSRPDVTLLGDSAHLMSPFAGEGANMAMQDGAELALELVKATDPADAIAAYEAKMFERTKPAAEQSAQGLEMFLAPDGAERMAQFMSSVHETGGP